MTELNSQNEDPQGPHYRVARKGLSDRSEAAAAPLTAIREGLPPTYRMRADPHYVEQLTSRLSPGREQVLDPRSIEAPPLADIAPIGPLVESIRRHGVLQPLLVQARREGPPRLIAGRKRLVAAIAAGIRSVPCVVHAVNDDEARVLADAADLYLGPMPSAAAPADARPPIDLDGGLAQSLSALTSCAGLLSGPVSELTRRVGINLIAAEAWRASMLLQAARALRAKRPAVRAVVSPRKVIARAIEGFEPERQLRGLQLDAQGHLADSAGVVADEQLLLLAVSGAISAMAAFAEGVSGARLTITTAEEPSARVALTVSQRATRVPPQWPDRAFDETWTERPGGLQGLVMTKVFRRVAELLDGSASAAVLDGGTALALSLPAVGAS